MQESLKSELERESSVRAEAEAKLRETEQSLKSIQAKSKQLISALQQQVEEQSNARVGSLVQHVCSESCADIPFNLMESYAPSIHCYML